MAAISSPAITRSSESWLTRMAPSRSIQRPLAIALTVEAEPAMATKMPTISGSTPIACVIAGPITGTMVLPRVTKVCCTSIASNASQRMPLMAPPLVGAPPALR